MNAKKIYTVAKEYSIISVGIFLYCFGWTGFLIPHGIAGGGVTGLATVIFYASGIPVPISYLCINVLLLVIGTLSLGRGFGMKTIYSIALATLFFQFLPEIIPWVSDMPEKFLNAIIGGTVCGVGIAVIFSQGGSTGGTDIVALIIAKYRETSPGKVFLYCDLLIIGSIIFLPDKGFRDVVYGYLQMVSFSYILDMILTGNKQSVQMLIFSSEYEKVADLLIKTMDRGVTALNAVGWYTRKESQVLIVIARKSQLGEITRAIKEVDNNAFISVSQTMSVYGNGFDQIKGGGKISWKTKQK